MHAKIIFWECCLYCGHWIWTSMIHFFWGAALTLSRYQVHVCSLCACIKESHHFQNQLGKQSYGRTLYIMLARVIQLWNSSISKISGMKWLETLLQPVSLASSSYTKNYYFTGVHSLITCTRLRKLFHLYLNQTLFAYLFEFCLVIMK